MILLDTTFMIDYFKGRDYTVKYLEANSDRAFFISTITSFELHRGALRSDRAQDNLQTVENLGWLTIQEFTHETAHEAAEIEQELKENGDMINFADILIAGTARAIGGELASTDRHFQKIDGLVVHTPDYTTPPGDIDSDRNELHER